MKRALIAVALALSAYSGTDYAYAMNTSHWPANLTAADRAAIETTIKKQDEAWNAGDAKTFTGNGLDDVALTSVIGSFMIGQKEWQAETTETMATAAKGSTMECEIEHVAAPTKDVVVLGLIMVVRGMKGLPAELLAPDGGVYSRVQQVMVRDGAAWRVVSVHGVFIKKPFLPKSALR